MWHAPPFVTRNRCGGKRGDMAGGEHQMEGLNKYQDMMVVMVIIFGGLF
jgi:hypothetical protein